MPNDPNASVPAPSALVWRNWSGNLVHEPASDGVKYYFTPTNLAELKSALSEAARAPAATVRVSGQRHSRTPLVVDEDRDPRRPRRSSWICPATEIWGPVRTSASCRGREASKSP